MNLALTQTLALLARYFRPQRKRVVFLAILLAGSIALQLINPLLVRSVVDTAQSGTTTARIVLAALLFILFGLGQAAFNLAATYIGERLKSANKSKLPAITSITGGCAFRVTRRSRMSPRTSATGLSPMKSLPSTKA